jgi:hypothetical protein
LCFKVMLRVWIRLAVGLGLMLDVVFCQV